MRRLALAALSIAMLCMQIEACGARTELMVTGSDAELDSGIALVDATPGKPDAPLQCVTMCPEAQPDAAVLPVCVDTNRDPLNCGGCGIACKVSETCSNARCIDVVNTLTGLRWELPCVKNTTSGSCTTPGLQTKTTSVGGDKGVTYDVTLHFRGVVETEGYTGGSNDGAFFQVGGAPIMDTWNIYKLQISSPPQTFYLNRGEGGLFFCFGIDYTKTIQMTAGAVITLTADPVDSVNEEIQNIDKNGKPIVVPGVSPAPAAFNGQFIQMDVVSIK